MPDGATYFAWFILTLLAGVAVGLIVWLGSLPGAIAARRNHPQADAINALSWFGLLLGGLGWVLAFVWALYRPAGGAAADPDALSRLRGETDALKQRVAELESRLAEQNKGGPAP
ncbi:Inner membrane protein YiaW [Posidoniimonas corsicana]|uniref:Inner membrane protein YiaW n=1 Tax=Posidoniimonas corsicana TaxID=1938618 RepID=A0A5C5VH42_9BACT|nr:DUF3302 domain-containing protein [Posidoniimonas corsicana]TWT37313.1 Inner membrane protein YiaW [Posidoniimonas corsicana]